MTVLVPNVNSDSYYIRIGWLERLKLLPPFNGAAKVSRSTARPIQAENLPFLGGYELSDNGGPDGDANVGEPRFVSTLKLGFSWIVVDNDTEEAEDMLDRAYWAFMKLLHDPNWKDFGNGIRCEAITEYSIDKLFGNRLNETPIAEVQMQITLVHRVYFSPIIDDAFEVLHTTTEQAGMEPAEVRPIITILNLPQ